MTTKDKRWALNQLRHRKNSFLLALCSVNFFKGPALDSLKGKRFLFKGASIVFDPLESERTGKRLEFEIDQLIQSRDNTPDDFNYDVIQLIKSARRNFVKESFEAIRAYTEENSSSLKTNIINEPWFNYARLIRNAVSHDLHWHFSKKDIPILPVSYNAITIDISLNGQDITEQFLHVEDLLYLWIDMNDFVNRS
jgi:hypothetical protein